MFLLRAILILTMLFMISGLCQAESVYIVQPNLKEIKFKSMVVPDTVVQQPSCPSGWLPSIFVTPSVVSAYSAATGWQLNVITVFKTWAINNGDGTWTAKLQVKDNQGNLMPAGFQMLLVETMCCPSGGNCQ